MLARLAMEGAAAGLGRLELAYRSETPGGWGPARYYRFPGRTGHDRGHLAAFASVLRGVQPVAAHGRRQAPDLPLLDDELDGAAESFATEPRPTCAR